MDLGHPLGGHILEGISIVDLFNVNEEPNNRRDSTYTKTEHNNMGIFV
jgi:hypothetical protein